MGAVESARGRLDEALACFNAAEAVRFPLIEKVSAPLALTWLGAGRAFLLQCRYKEAREYIERGFNAFSIRFGWANYFTA